MSRSILKKHIKYLRENVPECLPQKLGLKPLVKAF
jgi:hypothetical protein